MESTDLSTSTPPENDPLDALLQQQFRAPPLADGGFSARVTAALPVRPKTFLGLRRFDWSFLGVACGLAFALGEQLGWDPVNRLGSQLDAQAVTWLNLLLDSNVLLALAITAGTLALVSYDEAPWHGSPDP